MIFTNLIIAKLFGRRKSGLCKEIFYFSAAEQIQNEVSFLAGAFVRVFHFHAFVRNLYRFAVNLITTINILPAVLKISLQNLFSIVENVLVIPFVNYKHATTSQKPFELTQGVQSVFFGKKICQRVAEQNYRVKTIFCKLGIQLAPIKRSSFQFYILGFSVFQRFIEKSFINFITRYIKTLFEQIYRVTPIAKRSIKNLFNITSMKLIYQKIILSFSSSFPINKFSPHGDEILGVIIFCYQVSVHRIKKFSSPKIKIWFEPMFFSGFFCGFERCGSAAFPDFRGGTSSPPAAAKCVRTNSRILKGGGAAPLKT